MKQLDEAVPGITQAESLAVKLIDPSPANPREDVSMASIEELAVSIASQGLLQAIIVRPHPTKEGRYEIVCGERRFQAFKHRRWSTIPAVIRDLSDSEAHDITVVENLQRENLSPLEEARGIQTLLNDGRDAKEIADRLGKPVSWVVKRAKLKDLSPRWLQELSKEKSQFKIWSAAHLELIARYEQDLQDEILKSLDGSWNVGTMSTKELEKYLGQFHLKLSSAPWSLSDETICDAAGACDQCQKRASCTPLLFDLEEETVEPKHDKCLDRECWSKKLSAFHEIKLKKLREEHEKVVIFDNADYNSHLLPADSDLRKQAVSSYKYDKAKKDEKGAFPAYIVDGPGAGKFQWVKPNKMYSEDREVGSDGKTGPKPLKVRRKELEKRRTIRYITKIMMLLKGEDPATTGKKAKSGKPGVCRECGCTETTPCEDINGETCSWVEPDLCSACSDKNAPSDESRQIAIADKVQIERVLALTYIFGASSGGFRMECDSERDAYQAIHEDVRKCANMALIAVFDRIIDRLRQSTYAPDPDRDLPDLVCEVIGLDKEQLTADVLTEIPEPKSWEKLKADGTPKKAVPKKSKAEKGEEIEDPEDDDQAEE